MVVEPRDERNAAHLPVITQHGRTQQQPDAATPHVSVAHYPDNNAHSYSFRPLQWPSGMSDLGLGIATLALTLCGLARPTLISFKDIT